MADSLYDDDSLINSIIGEGTRFNGDISVNGLIRIDGDILGTITTEGKVLVGKTGRAKSNITAETVVIGGVVKGNVIARGKVVVLSSGMVLGDIYSPRLVAEDGVLLNGKCVIREDAVQAASERRLYVANDRKETSSSRRRMDYDRFNPDKESGAPADRSWKR